MVKLLKAAHIGFVMLMLLYCGEQLARVVAKWIDPTGDSVRFWKPGAEMVVIGVALIALIGILAYSTGLVKVRNLLAPIVLHLTWFVCLTWFGWFSSYAPFRLQEFVRVDLADPAAVRRAETTHLLQAVAVYLVIGIVIGFPVILRWYRKGGNPSSGSSPAVPRD